MIKILTDREGYSWLGIQLRSTFLNRLSVIKFFIKKQKLSIFADLNANDNAVANADAEMLKSRFTSGPKHLSQFLQRSVFLLENADIKERN